MLFHNFSVSKKREKVLDSVFPLDFYVARMKGMLDGIFMFSKSEKHINKIILPMDLFSCLGEGKRDGIFNFRESEKHTKKTPRVYFFISLVSLNRKRDNLSRE